MSKIYDEFMSNYNKLAEINDKPLIKVAEDLPMLDPSEGMPEEDMPVDDYTNYDVSTPSDKMQSVGVKAAIDHLKEAIGALETSEDPTIKYLTKELGEIKDRLMLKALGGSE